MTKFFKACHRETKEKIEFGLEDLYAYPETRSEKVGMRLVATVIIDNIEIGSPGNFIDTKQFAFTDWLKDYEVFYQHQGEWFKYEIN